jgi:hypothetical protein
VIRTLATCHRQRVPVTVRGGVTGNYGQASAREEIEPPLFLIGEVARQPRAGGFDQLLPAARHSGYPDRIVFGPRSRRARHPAKGGGCDAPVMAAQDEQLRLARRVPHPRLAAFEPTHEPRAIRRERRC